MIVIQSNSITIKDGRVLMKEADGITFTPGGVVLEGQDPEEVCENKAGDVKIVKPLHPSIMWKNFDDEKIPFVSLNYLTELKDV